VHIDEHVTGAAGLGVEVADLAGSIASRRQSSSPTALSEKRPSLGGVSLARATLSFAARSDPYQGLTRAPFRGLRVVATRSVGLVESSAASRTAGGEHVAGAAADGRAERQRAGGGDERAQHGAAASDGC
jgi:hypothetical protein